MPSPAHQVTNDDVGPAINVMSWFLICTTFLAVALRGLTKSFVSRLANDDFMIFTSLILSAGISATDVVQVNNGLGQRMASIIDDSRKSNYEKAHYAGNLLYVLVLTLSKLSVLYFYQKLTPMPAHRRVIKFSSPLLILWGATSFFVYAFQCPAPKVWSFVESKQCMNRLGFSTVFDVGNILFEIVLVAFPVYVVTQVQTNTSKKVLLISCFLARLLVVASLSAEIATRFAADTPADMTYNSWPIVVSKQLTHSLSIVTACIPYYISWVPHAFRMYADTYSNHAARTRKVRTSQFNPAIELGESIMIRKTIDINIEIEGDALSAQSSKSSQGSQASQASLSDAEVPIAAMTRYPIRGDSSDNGSVDMALRHEEC